MEGEIAAAVAQFGVAGLIGWMWLSERRASAARERQLTEAHDRIMREDKGIEVLVSALNENTRALTSLEAGQRGLVSSMERMSSGRGGRAAG